MKNFDVELNYLEHDGGTKFYETVVITERLPSSDAGPSILIQRWGKIAANTGGGQNKMVKGSLLVTAMERDRIINDKLKYRSGKGKYDHQDPPFFGLGRLICSAAVSSRQMTEREIAHHLSEHYQAGDDMAILNYFGMDADEDGSSLDDDIVSEGEGEPPAEPDRGENWASW